MSFVTAATRPHGFHDAVSGTPDQSSYIDGQSQHHHPHYAASAMSDPTKHGYYNPNVPPQMSCEIKPRLTKEQHDILEAHFLKQNKPNTQTKKSFAESLNVSLDKVNNWFQNRRAKSKQDAKKQQAGATGTPSQPPQSASSPAQQSTTSSTNGPATGQTSRASETSSDASPAFSAVDYFSTLQSCPSDEHLSLGTSHAQPLQEQSSSSSSEHSWSYSDSALDHLAVPPHLGHDMFDSAQDLNRRTLTQEQFDAFAQNAGLMRASDDFGHSEDDDVLHQFFPDMDLKRADDMSMLGRIAPPLSSHDSSIPSSISERSMFPSNSNMQDFSSISTTSSDWTDSRSSSVSGIPAHDSVFQQPPPTSSAQWQPGQSIPVDPTAQFQQFREAAQARHMQQSQAEQPMAWPSDDAYARRESQSSAILAQQMSNFGLQTPAPTQDGAFKAPPPPASIAARRQRPRPAALGLASLRSQSYSGAGQTSSPGQGGIAGQTNAPQLRRIRSVNVLNGGAPGRVMKTTPGSAQRSPLNWTFADAMVSPKALRHSSSASMGSLAPPTPMSPRDPAAMPQFPPWQSSFSRQASISETDDEHNVPLPSASGGFTANFSSPPHTPMFQHPQQQQQQQQQFVQVPMNAGNVVTENTPPQSAPAAQQTFPASAYVLSPQQAQASQQAGAFMAAQQQAYMNGAHSDPRFHMHPAPQYMPAGPGAEMSMQFAHGMPVVDAQGNVTMAFPHQMQFIPHATSASMPMPQKPAPSQFNFVSSSEYFGSLPMAANIHKPSPPTAELFVHEYSPPSDVKQSAAPRKAPATDSGPKNYTFANHGPEHFEKEKVKKAASDSKPSVTESPTSAATS